MADGPPEISIVRLDGLDGSRRAELIAGLEPIFYLNASRAEFASEDERRAFHDRWLGRYLRHYPEWFYFAVDADGVAAGYLAGCPDSAGAAGRFEDIPHYRRFSRCYAEFPAHLHCNVRVDLHGRGIGGALVARFADDCRTAGLRGFHAITATSSRAVRFYERCGMRAAMTLPMDGYSLVLLAKAV